MRILHVINDLRRSSGGAPKAVLELCQAFSRLGVETALFYGSCAAPEENVSHLANDGTQVFRAPLISLPGLGILRSTDSLKQAVAWADIVVLHGIYQGVVLSAARLCRRSNKPYFVMPHCSITKSVRERKRLRNSIIDVAYHRRYLEAASGLIFTNSAEERLSEKPDSPSTIVPLGVHASDYAIAPDAADQVRRRYEIPPHHSILLFLGRVTWKKGVTVLLDAFPRAQLPSPSTLILAGPIDREMRPAMQSAIQMRNPDRRVLYVGTADRAMRDQLYSAADASVLPSFAENYGYAAVESLLYGTPLIVSRGVAIWERLASAGAAFICEPNARELQLMIEEWGGRRRNLSQRHGLREVAIQEFGWEAQEPALSRAINRLHELGGVLPTASATQ